MRKIILAAFALLVVATVVPRPEALAQNAAGFVVVVHRQNPVSSLTRSEVSRIFMTQTRRWGNGQGVQPVDLAGGSAVRAQFSQRIHGRSALSVTNFWRQQIFAGRGVPPPEQATDADVVRFVASHSGGIGYVSASTNVSSVKTVVISDL
jgi:ABC-type phosphate transport system substrate-binding protein